LTIELCTGGGGTVPDTNVFFIGNLNTLNLGDDVHSPIINISFPFTFYGNIYNNVVMSSNGYLTFNAGSAGTFSPWAINQAVPSPGVPTNSIMGPWQDYAPHLGGTVGWAVIGTAPNRRFVAVWKEVEMFGDAMEGCSAIVLHETSNKIEIFLDEKPVVPWNGGAAIEAIHNQPGTIAHVVPGRNWPTQWTANLDGQEWIPDGPNNYIQSPIPHKAYVIGNASVTWADTEGNTYNTAGSSITVTPSPSAPSDSIGYFINYSSCAVNSMLTSDTSWVKVNNVNVITNGTDDVCSAALGEAVATASGGSEPYNYQWNDPMMQNGPIATGLTQGVYTVLVTDAIGCTAVTNVTIGDTPISLSSTYTQVSCPGGSDGTATVNIIPSPASATYNWIDAGGQTTQTATGLGAGTYTVEVETDNGCTDQIQVVVDEIPGMQVSLVSSSDVTCNSGNDGMVEVSVNLGTAPYSYSWTNSSSTTNTATDLPAGLNTVTITDANGCVVTFDFTLSEPTALQITSVSDDLIVCVGDSIEVSAEGAGGSSDYIFSWTVNGSFVGLGESIYVTPNQVNSQICVTLSEVCGSPTTTECFSIDHPDDIDPLIIPSTTGECVPVEVVFSNVTNSSVVDYTIWHYGDGTVDTIQALGDGENTYENVGLYDVSLEIVSEFGCRYFKNFNSLISGFGYPTADFYANPSPASVFEPNVTVYSNSSTDVAIFEWFAEGANPAYSNLQNVPLTYPNEVGEYPVTLVVTNGNGCADTIMKPVIIRNDVILYAPNTFTPDGDKNNDRWRVYIDGIDVKDFRLEVFNRWGEIVFESRNPEGEWDGKYGGFIAKEGTYIWKIRAADVENDNKYEFNGHVTILR
jgi:gliding motility-associated-like protein